jgi:RNA polymerase sigma-70 factor, ECF subfamily
MTDEQLVQRVRDGDIGAFEELVLRYQKPIYGFVLRLLRDPAEAEDTVQKVFLLVYQNLKNFRFEASFKTWLYRISINQCHNVFRRHKNREFTPVDDLPLADAKTSQEEDYAHKEILALAQKAIDKLPPKQRQVLLLRVYQDLSFEEIGQALNIRANSAKVNFHYALEKIKERMRNQP